MAALASIGAGTLAIRRQPISERVALTYRLGLTRVRAPLLTLTVWVSSLMIIASYKSIHLGSGRGLVSIILTLSLVLVLTFRVNNMVRFYVAFEASLIPTLILILG